MTSIMEESTTTMPPIVEESTAVTDLSTTMVPTIEETSSIFPIA